MSNTNDVGGSHNIHKNNCNNNNNNNGNNNKFKTEFHQIQQPLLYLCTSKVWHHQPINTFALTSCCSTNPRNMLSTQSTSASSSSSQAQSSLNNHSHCHYHHPQTFIQRIDDAISKTFPSNKHSGQSTLPQINSLEINDQVTSSSIINNNDVEQQQQNEKHQSTNIIEIDNDTSDWNWQANKKNLRERNSMMLMNELMSDVVFIVGPEKKKISAHKYVLATSSSVFYAMFYGNLAEKNHEIVIPDIESNAFISMLRYLYCEVVEIEQDYVLSLLYCAKKYLLPHLTKRCVQYLDSHLTAQNACLLLSQSRLFDEDDLTEKCYEVIDAQAELALTSNTFLDIDHTTLKSIITRETLNAKELTIFKAVLRWANEECKRRKIKETTENRRSVLGDALYLIRIPTMNLEEFANGPAQQNILSTKEINDIFLYFTASRKPILMFPIKKRCGLILEKCHRFLSSAYRSNQWRYRGRCDCIQFSVDKRVFIVGFGLYGSSNGAHEYKVRIQLRKHDEVLAEKHTRLFSDGSSNTFQVFFDYPILINVQTGYIASALLDGIELSYFGQDGLSEVKTETDVNFQFQSSLYSTNGTGVQGGQIPEILYYGPIL